MNKKEILESNKLIAEFEYGKLCENLDSDEDCLVKDEDSGFINFYISDSLYHKSWDWLMPVVERIEELGASTDIHYFGGLKKHSMGIHVFILGYKFEYNNSIFEEKTHYNSKITAVYKAVVKFIKWYNENKKV